MKQVKIYDNQFGHSPWSWGSGHHPEFKSQLFEWYRGEPQISNIAVFTESRWSLVDTAPEKFKVAMLLEWEGISPITYRQIQRPSLFKKFDKVLTHSKELLGVDPRFCWYPFSGCWVSRQDWALHYKHIATPSIIYSQKDWTYGHQLRHKVVKTLGPKVKAFQNIKWKIEGLRDYMYHIAIENTSVRGSFSEKILDAFVTGCVPIYWGDPGLGEVFNMDGVIEFDSEEDLPKILEGCTEYDYQRRLPAVMQNFQIAQQFVPPEDYLWRKHLSAWV